MQVIETNAEGLRREFKVVIPASDFQSRLEMRLQEVGRSIRVPGFRPGKVPMSLLKQRYGRSLLGEILERTVSDSSSQLMSERGLRPAGAPKIEIVSFEEGNDLEYSLAVELIPDITPTDFREIKLDRLVAEVPDSEVEAALQRLADRHRRTRPVETPRPAAKGDVLVLDYVGRVDGKEFAGGSATEQYVELGVAGLLPGFEEQLLGAKAGDHVDVKVTFPEEHPNKELAGREAVFSVTVREHREPQAVAVDDEFAKELGAENLEALRRVMRDRIQNEYAALTRSRLKRQLLDALAATHEFTLPTALVDAEFDAIWRQIEADRKEGRLDPEDQGKSEDELKAEYRDIAARRVKLGLLLSEVGRLNNILVGDEEVGRAIMAEARRYPGRERQVVEFYQKTPQALARLRAPLYEDKVVDFILELAQITERKVTPEKLLSLPGAETSEPPRLEDGSS
jgi:trigger factor